MSNAACSHSGRDQTFQIKLSKLVLHVVYNLESAFRLRQCMSKFHAKPLGATVPSKTCVKNRAFANISFISSIVDCSLLKYTKKHSCFSIGLGHLNMLFKKETRAIRRRSMGGISTKIGCCLWSNCCITEEEFDKRMPGNALVLSVPNSVTSRCFKFVSKHVWFFHLIIAFSNA